MSCQLPIKDYKLIFSTGKIKSLLLCEKWGKQVLNLKRPGICDGSGRPLQNI
jgi:hypothetical protein